MDSSRVTADLAAVYASAVVLGAVALATLFWGLSPS